MAPILFLSIKVTSSPDPTNCISIERRIGPNNDITRLTHYFPEISPPEARNFQSRHRRSHPIAPIKLRDLSSLVQRQPFHSSRLQARDNRHAPTNLSNLIKRIRSNSDRMHSKLDFGAQRVPHRKTSLACRNDPAGARYVERSRSAVRHQSLTSVPRLSGKLRPLTHGLSSRPPIVGCRQKSC